MVCHGNCLDVLLIVWCIVYSVTVFCVFQWHGNLLNADTIFGHQHVFNCCAHLGSVGKLADCFGVKSCNKLRELYQLLTDGCQVDEIVVFERQGRRFRSSRSWSTSLGSPLPAAVPSVNIMHIVSLLIKKVTDRR